MLNEEAIELHAAETRKRAVMTVSQWATWHTENAEHRKYFGSMQHMPPWDQVDRYHHHLKTHAHPKMMTPVLRWWLRKYRDEIEFWRDTHREQ